MVGVAGRVSGGGSGKVNTKLLILITSLGVGLFLVALIIGYFIYWKTTKNKW